MRIYESHAHSRIICASTDNMRIIYAYTHNISITAIVCAECADAHNAQQRTCAYAHYAHLRIVCAECASAHNMRRMRICALNAHYLRICANAHHLRSCPCRLRSRRLSSCPHCNSGGGGSCRRQWKSAAPMGRRGELVV